MINDEADEVMKAKKTLKNNWNQWNVVSLHFIMFIHCIINAIIYFMTFIIQWMNITVSVYDPNCSGSYTDTPDRIKNTKA